MEQTYNSYIYTQNLAVVPVLKRSSVYKGEKKGFKLASSLKEENFFK